MPAVNQTGTTSHEKDTERKEAAEVMSCPQASQERPPEGRSSSRKKVTEEVKLKIEKVMKRVYDWGCLRLAWKQIYKNAGQPA